MITLSVIAKNEQDNLPILLKSVRDWVDEIIIVDTGSTDETVAIAKDYGAQVDYFEWCDDFSKARNYAMSLVKTPWMLTADCDDMVLNPEIIQVLLEGARKKRINAIWSIYKQDSACLQRRVQIVKTKDYYWKGIVHESLQPKNPHTANSILSDLVFLHRKPPERCPEAARYYLDTLLAKDPTNWLGIAESYKYLTIYPDRDDKLDEYADLADQYYWRAFNHPKANDPTKYLCLVNGAQINIERAFRDKKWFQMAHRQAQLGVALYPHRAEAWVLLGQTWEGFNLPHKAVESYETAMMQELPMDDIGLVYPGYYDEIPKKLLAALRERLEKEREPLIYIAN